MNKRDEIENERLARRRAQEDANLFGRLSAAAAASRAEAQKALKTCSGLSVLEWRVLWDLHDAGPLSVRDMANIQHADHSLISRALPQMRAKGYVILSQDPNDKRQTLVSLAPAGLAAFQSAAPTMKARRDRLQETFTSSDLAQFIALIERLESYLDAERNLRIASSEAAE